MKQQTRQVQRALTVAAVGMMAAVTPALGAVYFFETFSQRGPSVYEPIVGWAMRNQSTTNFPNPRGWAWSTLDEWNRFDDNGLVVSLSSDSPYFADISIWLVSPVISAPAGARVSFVSQGGITDRLQLRASDGVAWSVGSGPYEVGTFRLLMEVNRDYDRDCYPNDVFRWAQYQCILPQAFHGRFAFRYVSKGAGQWSSIVGMVYVDAFHVSDPDEPLPTGNFPPPLPPPPPPPPPVPPHLRPQALPASIGGSINVPYLDSDPTPFQWVRFYHPGGAFHVDTLGFMPRDSEMALYDRHGYRIAFSDDYDDLGYEWAAQLNIADLPAGAYYLIVGGYDLHFGATGFEVTVRRNPNIVGGPRRLVINGLSVAPALLPGDFSMDGLLDPADIDPFVAALLEGQPYAQFVADHGDAFDLRYGVELTPDVVRQLGDINNDGVFDSDDIDPFLELVQGSSARPGAAAIPEPATLGLLALPMMLAVRRTRSGS